MTSQSRPLAPAECCQARLKQMMPFLFLLYKQSTKKWNRLPQASNAYLTRLDENLKILHLDDFGMGWLWL